jgi:hypothetical protein
MKQHLTSGQRRFAALSLLVMVVAVIWMAIARPVIDEFQSHTEDRIADLRALSRDRALVSQASLIHGALANLEQSPRWARFYGGQRQDKALSQMEADLRELLKAPNNPTSMTAQNVTAKGLLMRLAVKVTLSMSIDQWTDTLARLQAHSKFLQIDALTIQAPDYQNVDSNPTLSIQAEIVGYWIPPLGTRT